MSFARITLFGNLGSDPETRFTPSGATVVSFSLAVDSRKKSTNGKADPVWYRISCWDLTAERIAKLTDAGHIAKGRSLYVEGTFEPREFSGNDGTTRVSYDVTMTDFQFVGGQERQDGQSQQRPTPMRQQASSSFTESLDEVPFD
ncbi:MAG: single-stranded DNA-binding protein [Thermomicrobiales bacterium]